jgi:hypothetical protein
VLTTLGSAESCCGAMANEKTVDDSQYDWLPVPPPRTG